MPRPPAHRRSRSTCWTEIVFTTVGQRFHLQPYKTGLRMQRFTYWRYLQYAPLLLAFLLIGLITAYRRESTQSDGVATPLAIDSPFLSLGKVPAIQNFKWKAELRNASKYDLNVERFDASCTCVSISPHKATIPSGGKCMLDLTLDFSNIVVQGGENVTHHEFALVPVIKGARRSGTEFVFKSIVVPAFTVSPPRISRVGYDALTYSTQPVSIHAEVALLREDITLSAISRPPTASAH